jgi:hypothetical protein
VELLLTRSHRPTAWLTYRYTHLQIENGSIYDPDASTGSSGHHDVQRAGVRFIIPVTDRIGIDADWFLFFRKSRYDSPDLQDKSQRNPEARLSLAWTWGQ